MGEPHRAVKQSGSAEVRKSGSIASTMPTYPIEHVRISGFGPVTSGDIELSSELTVITGDNGTGKSQLLKLLYVSTRVLQEGVTRDLTRSELNRTIADNLLGVFRPDSLGRLASRARGQVQSLVYVDFLGFDNALEFSFSSRSKSEVKTLTYPKEYLEDPPVFLPTRELMSIYPGFVSLYNERALEFDQTWRDTCDLLGRPVFRGKRYSDIAWVLEPIEEVMNGRVVEEGGRFYLQRPGQGKIEMHLLAEGLRKLAMLARLVASGTLLDQGYLFWDEPEANLNPKTLRAVAMVIERLAHQGVQVVIATHSTFLLREISGGTEGCEGTAPRYIGLSHTDHGIEATSTDDLDELPELAALDAELAQTDEYLAE